MTTFYDVPADLLNPVLAGKLSEIDAISRPQWADYVKTGVHRERPQPKKLVGIQGVLRYSARLVEKGPIGVNSLAQAYGGRKDNGSNPNTPAMGSRYIIRTALQQLSDAGLIP